MREYKKPGRFGLAALALIGVVGLAGLAAGLRAHSLRSAQSFAAAGVASRSQPGEIAPPRIAPSEVATAPVTAAEFAPSVFSPMPWQESRFLTSDSSDAGELFSPVPSYPVAAGTAARSAGQAAAPEGGPAADVLRRRAAYRPRSVLNDAQIASIKERLNLTPEQEAMWPPVEAALRQISYIRNPAETRRAQPSTARLAFIDPDSTELRQLKYAALPLIMRLNDDQKREVNSLAHVMGLGKLASE